MYKWWKIKYYFGKAMRNDRIWTGGKIDFKEILVIAHDEEEAQKVAKMQIAHQTGNNKAINFFKIEPELDK